MIDLFGQLGNVQELYEDSDSRALAADWFRVGDDLTRALTKNPELPGFLSRCETQLRSFLELEEHLRESLREIREQNEFIDQARQLSDRLEAVQEQVNSIRDLREQIEKFSELFSGIADPADGP